MRELAQHYVRSEAVHIEVKLVLVEGGHPGDPSVGDLRLEDPGVVEEEAEKLL